MRVVRDGRPALLCLPHAGASAAWYAAWRRSLDDCVDVVPVELPGRGRRHREPPSTSVPELVDSVRCAAHDRADGPVILYGHSLGALLAYELAHDLAAAGRPPALLVVSGRNAPSRVSERPPVHHLPDDELVEAIGDYAGTPREVLADRQLLDPFLPQLRADLRAAETYRYRARDPLAVPLLVLQGRDDLLVSADGVRAWREETVRECDVVWCTGGHFFHQQRGFAAETLRPRLLSSRAGSAAGGS
ncbi:MAG: thioesterase II family protein [Frankiaceae bacterium]